MIPTCRIEMLFLGALAVVLAGAGLLDNRLRRAALAGIALGIGVIAFALLVSGCGGQPRRYLMSYDVAVDPSFTVAQQTVIVEAVDAWRTAEPALTLRLTVGPCPGITTFCVAPETVSTGELGHSYDPGDDRGCVSKIAVDEIAKFASVWTAPGDPDALLRQTVEHELGHCMMGSEHLGSGALMCATPDCASMTLTVADLAHFAEVR
ncbi:MAG TPA: hypothetical protein VN894_17775 [Polyangiaceae bacterium]|nr:hypothetical protein [Polyangiaceae bacterium]